MGVARVQNVALIGTGMVAGTHLAAIADLPGSVRLRGVLGRDAARTQAFAARAAKVCGAPVTVYDDLATLCADVGLDWVIVLTPPDARADIVAGLAAAGKPVLMEKPVERDLARATALVELCERAGVPLGIVFQHRKRDVSLQLRDLVHSGALGDVAAVDVRVPWWRGQDYYDAPGRGTYARDGGGVLISQAIHTLDLMLDIAGPVTEARALTRTTALHLMEAEDFVAAGLTFANGAPGSVMATTAAYPGAAESITLHCTKGSAKLEAGTLRLWWHDGREETCGAAGGTGGGADPMAFTHAWHRDVIRDFAESIAAGRPPMVPGRAALAVHALIGAIVTSSATGRACPIAPQPREAP